MKKKDEDKPHIVTYWQSMADLVSGLLLVFILLSVLVLVQSRSAETGKKKQAEEVQSTQAVESVAEKVAGSREASVYVNNGGGGGGGGSTQDKTSGGGGSDTQKQAENKAAVRLLLVDGESGKVIPQAGISFRLTKEGAGDVTLSTYYPKLETFEEFETTSQGDFYLPEKIGKGTYTFSLISPPKGYEYGKDVTFTIDRNYDWDNPYVVQFPVYEAERSFEIRHLDTSGNGIAGTEYQIYAAEAIESANKKVHLKKGELAATVTTGKDGTVSSGLLYVGNYIVKESKPTDGYVSDEDEHEVKLTKSADSGSSQEVEITSDVTSVTMQLTDELYKDTPIPDVTYTVKGSLLKNAKTSYKTGDDGTFTVTGLKRGESYQLSEKASSGKKDSDTGYIPSGKTFTFTVDEDGLVYEKKTDKGQADLELTDTNRLIRVSISVVDRLFHKAAGDMALELTDSKGNSAASWRNAAGGHLVTGISPGTYTISIEGKTRSITVEDTASVQTFSFVFWTAMDTVILILACVLAVAGLTGLVVFLKKRSGKSQSNGK